MDEAKACRFCAVIVDLYLLVYFSLRSLIFADITWSTGTYNTQKSAGFVVDNGSTLNRKSFVNLGPIYTRSYPNGSIPKL